MRTLSKIQTLQFSGSTRAYRFFWCYAVLSSLEAPAQLHRDHDEKQEARRFIEVMER